MGGTVAGGRKASATNKERYGEDFYKNIGRMGGMAGHSGGFASMPFEKASALGKRGGMKSRRGLAISQDEVKNISNELAKGKTITEVAKATGWSAATVSRIRRKGSHV